jgi:hypothetical protein
MTFHVKHGWAERSDRKTGAFHVKRRGAGEGVFHVKLDGSVSLRDFVGRQSFQFGRVDSFAAPVPRDAARGLSLARRIQ